MCDYIFFFQFYLDQGREPLPAAAAAEFRTKQKPGDAGCHFEGAVTSAVSHRDTIGCLSLAPAGKNSMSKMKLRMLLCTGDTEELEPTARVNKQ